MQIITAIQADPQRYYELLHSCQVAQLFFASLKLEIFSHLDQWISPQQLAQKMQLHDKDLKYVLSALAATQLIEKNGSQYRNTPDGQAFLSKNSDYYIGETLLFREQMTSLADMDDKMTHSQKTVQPPYNFARLAEAVVPEMYATGRVEAFLREIDQLFPDKKALLNILDIGGGSGILSIEFVKQYPQSTAYVFEHPAVAPVSRKIIRQYCAQDMVHVIEGDFNRDDLGGTYDLVIASGILDFVSLNISDFMVKIASSLKQTGYLLLIGQHRDETEPSAQNILNWLSGHLNGLPSAPSGTEIALALNHASLTFVRQVDAGKFKGWLFTKKAEIRF